MMWPMFHFFAYIEAPAPAGRLDPSFHQAKYNQFDSGQGLLTALRAEEESHLQHLCTPQQRIALVQRGLVVKCDSIDVANELHPL